MIRFPIRKLWNILLVQFSFHISNLLKKPIVWGKPWFISIEPASVCNLSCPQCPVGVGDISRKNKFLDIDEYKKLLKEIAPTTAILSLYFQGEPLMHKQFPEFVRLASLQGIYTQTSTNGQLFTDDVCRGLVGGGLDRIIVSLDGLDQESYEAYRRGGDLGKTLEGIRNLVRIRNELGSRKQGRRKPRIILQFLVFKHNQDQVKEVKQMARQLGADKVWIKSAQVEYPETADEFIPEDKSRYFKNSAGEWKLKGRLKNSCKRLWQTTVVTSDGFIVPCCFDKRAEYPMGDFSNSGDPGNSGYSGAMSLAEIWKSKSYQDFRRRVLRDRKGIAICNNCTEGIGRIYG